ncbi:ADYC domain-containing protein [Polyangium aurulentum]|uniref:ADYC domain-containing protein n=1 Tax=Polyangium aurulentum TaxID=2567896 RepID=UPI0010AEDB7D|nr:ADYC domain-containing protein [Polyangium aurulentum]UQA60292.1 hypothetical protein E8A73_007385 [Polyangium aurulentum]
MFRENRTAKIVVLSVMGLAGCFGAAVAPQNAVPLVHMPRVAQPEELYSAPGAPAPQEITTAKRPPADGIVHPQSFGYFGGGLESYAYFYQDSSLGPSEVKAHLRNGAITAQDVTLTMTDSGVDDPCNPSTPNLDLYTVTYDGVNQCEGKTYEPGPEDTCTNDQNYTSFAGKAIKVPGAFDTADGKYKMEIGGKRVFSLSCMSGAVAKCAHWGYVPGNDTTSRTAHFSACVHAARAEYTTGISHTCSGTQVDFVDNIGLQPVSYQNLALEAAWGADGLLCLDAARFPACNNSVPPEKKCTSAQMSWQDSRILLWTRSKADNKLPSPYTAECPVNGNYCR